MKEQQMEAPGNPSHSHRSQRSRSKLPSKQSVAESRLQRQNSHTRLDKRRSGGQRKNEQVEWERAFRLHSRKRISEDQALFSLKMLGLPCRSPEDYARIHRIWSRYGPTVDEEAFKALAEELTAKTQSADHSEAFNILTQGRMALDERRLAAVGEEVGVDTSGIMKFCGKEGSIDFSTFSSILKFTNALT